FLFYSLVHLGKAGYILSITPLFLILGIFALYKINKKKSKILIINSIILLQIISFIFINTRTENKIIKKSIINVAPYEINLKNLKRNDQKLKSIFDEIKQYNPLDTVLFTEADSPYVKNRENFIKSFRHLGYYLPQYNLYHLFNDQNTKKYYQCQNNKYRLLYQQNIPLDKNIKNILLITDNYNYDVYDFKTIITPDNEIMFYKDISNLEEFEYLKYNFVKQN
ncbi:hypothetical protein K8R66_00510, partial [bacterium]|nr:hypothetical protein [bacterium]